MKTMWGAGMVTVMLVVGCTKRPISPGEVPTAGEKRPDLEMQLADGTQLRMDDARANDAAVCGDVQSCSGPSCETIRADRCVPKDRIASIAAREVNQPAVALGVIGGIAAATIVTVALASAAHSGGTSKTQAPPPPARSSSYGSGYGGGSCPRIYSWDGTSWELDSGTYGLSYFEAAPRTDFDRLDHVVAENGTYRFRLINEEYETEHTDLVRLHVVDHPAGTRVVPTGAGKLVTLRNEAAPMTAKDFRGRDALDAIAKADHREWTSDLADRHLTRADDARDGLRLVFAKPRDAKIAKLRVGAHNTKWAGQMLGYLLAHRGPTLSAWWTQMNRDARARGEFEAFMMREGMLNVRVKTSAGWKTRGLFWAAGPEIVKEEAFELAVGDVPGDTVEIELESALDFWSIDAATIAFGNDEPIVVHDLSPSSARTTKGEDISALLARADDHRFNTVRGDVAELSFTAPAAGPTGSIRSFVVETKGYDIPEITPAADADPAAMDALLNQPFAASRLALAFRVATAPIDEPKR